MNIAFITGITGQDGSYLAEFLLEKNYQIHAIIRRSSSFNTKRIDHIFNHPLLNLHYGDLSDNICIDKIFYLIESKYHIDSIKQFEIYNLAAMSHVKVSFDIPEYTGNIDGLGTLRLLDRCINSPLKDKIKFYQASTSELYGKVKEIPQNEETPFYPRSPYAVSKLYSFWITKNYREAYNFFACNGILFNHESPRRGETFVTRKITIGLNKILKGESDKIIMGNIDSLRDWGYAKDYVEGMWLMLQHHTPDDFVLATGETHSVREFIEKSFLYKGIHIKWKGNGINEIGYDEITKRELIFIDPKYFRPTEVDLLLGDPSKAINILGWKSKTSFDELIKIMIDYDCN